MSNPESFNPQEKEAIRELVRKTVPSRHAMVFGQMLVDISSQFGKNPMQIVEEILRKERSGTFLIAMPTANMSEFTSKLPHSGGQEYPYFAWICVNGEEEAEEQMLKVETNSKQNFLDLSKTGLLVPRPGTDISRQMHASSN